MEFLTRRFLNIKKVKKDVEGSTDRIIHSKQRSLETSINEGAAASVTGRIVANFITPFALALNATAFHIGILTSFYGLTASFSQLIGNKLTAAYSRKTIVRKTVLIEAILLIPIALLGILAWKGFFQPYLLASLIAIYVISSIFSGIAFVTWFSWMGDLVPAKDRGAYFSVRHRATELVALATGLLCAFLLDTFKTKGLALVGFAVIFLIASIAKTISYSLFRKQYSPKFRFKQKYYFSIWNFLRTFDNYGKFAVYQACFAFSLMVASPFFAVYMLQELKFSYVTFTLVTISASMFYIIFSPLIGKFADRFGNTKLFFISNFLFILTPLFWLFLKTPLALILLPQFLAGIANAGFILSKNNFTYDSVSRQRRVLCVAYANILTGIGIFLGSLLGGYLISQINIFNMNSFFFVFCLASGLRLLTGLIFLPQIKEERKTEKIPRMHIDINHPSYAIDWLKTVTR